MDERVALVTGATSGIGRARRTLTREGAGVTAVDVRAITEPGHGSVPFVAGVAPL